MFVLWSSKSSLDVKKIQTEWKTWVLTSKLSTTTKSISILINLTLCRDRGSTLQERQFLYFRTDENRLPLLNPCVLAIDERESTSFSFISFCLLHHVSHSRFFGAKPGPSSQKKHYCLKHGLSNVNKMQRSISAASKQPKNKFTRADLSRWIYCVQDASLLEI